MSNVHPIFEPILNAIFPKEIPPKEELPSTPEKKEYEPTMEGFANWLIAGKPKL